MCDRLDAARRRLEARAKARAEAERFGLRGQGGGARDAHRPGQGQAPEAARQDAERADEQSNLSDPDSRLMRKSKQHEYFARPITLKPWWHAGGSQLIVGARVTNCASDRNELVADIAAKSRPFSAGPRRCWRTTAMPTLRRGRGACRERH